MKAQIDHLFLICAIVGFKFADVEKGEIIIDADGMRTDQSYLSVLYKKCMRRPTWSKNVVANPDRKAINIELKSLADQFIRDNVKSEDDQMKRQIEIALKKDIESRKF